MTFPYDALLVGALVTCLGCVALVLTQRWHARWSIDGSHGVQKFHTHPTPRVAGIAIVLGLFTSSWFLSADVKAVLMPMLWASLPAFVFGFVEDLTKKVGVRERLLATIASGILAWWFTGISLDRVNVWGLDALLTWMPVSVLFTAFAIGGVANAVNIIDGFNGLAAGVVMICLAALGVCAHRVGDPTLMVVCMVLVSVIAGFWLVNFPLGKIFLGDGGAYLIGFCLGWIAVLLPMRNPGISPWASLLACAYPILEVLFSILRRHRRKLTIKS
ncbi:MraY family glycosyltransferase, partial [Macromonas bipunctata]|uniref:MraY family glycosyltransferase n=1 Tax=Macromonas bipunctata TaxID=183670 RepID=UPI00197CAA88